MNDKKVVWNFNVICFTIVIVISIPLIILGQSGLYNVSNWVYTFKELLMNIPFSIYIMSPAIASFLVMRKELNMTVKEWCNLIFNPQLKAYHYIYVISILCLYFGLHMVVGMYGPQTNLGSIILSIPGGLVIGGLEEAGWMLILQPYLIKKYGTYIGTVMTAIIWTIWHIPLFYIAGTNHSSGTINFWMFTIQLFSFRFIHTSFMSLSKKNFVFMSILFHTLFNAASPIVGSNVMEWKATIIVNLVVVIVAVLVIEYCKRNNQHVF